jgi:hypothetical protein
MGKLSASAPRVSGPLIGSTAGFFLVGSNNTLVQTYTGGGISDVYWDLGNSGTLIVGSGAEAFAGSVTGSFFSLNYPAITAENSAGYFARYTSAADAEILNVFSNDYMYIGPYNDPAGGLTGTYVVYRAGFGNEGDGTWFTSPYGEYSFNTLEASVTAELGACFWIQGLAGDTTKPVLHVQARATGTVVQELTSEATNDNPIEKVVQNRVATTDATVTTLHTFTVPASTTYAIEAIVIARRTGGVSGTAEDGARYILNAVYKNVAGTATIIGVVTVTADESVAGHDATLTTSGATVLCRVTGAATTNITWHMTARTWQVSS